MSYRKSGKIRNKSRSGDWEGGSISTVLNGVAQKLRRIILLHFGLIFFRAHFSKKTKAITLFFRTWCTCPWLPKPIIHKFGYTKLLQVIQDKSESFLETIIWGKNEILGIENVGSVRKDGGRKSRRSVQWIVENLEYGISIYPKAWIGNFVIWRW